MELSFEHINATDDILIKTQNSEYRFRVVDPETRRGFLSGGSLGGQQRDATLVGTFNSSENSATGSEGIKQGARALFYLKAKRGIERLITSIITDISHRRGRGERRQLVA